MANLSIGTRIDHEKYGEGIVSRVKTASYEVIFIRGGEMEFSKTSHDFTVLETVEGQDQAASMPVFDVEAVEIMLTDILERYQGLTEIVPLGDRWIGGKLIIQSANTSLQSKEIPIENFFHKIVMLRDRLRVLEQNINSNDKLSDEEKIGLQQYITRVYGSLTTFNFLFRDKDQYFVGAGSK